MTKASWGVRDRREDNHGNVVAMSAARNGNKRLRFMLTVRLSEDHLWAITKQDGASRGDKLRTLIEKEIERLRGLR